MLSPATIKHIFLAQLRNIAKLLPFYPSSTPCKKRIFLSTLSFSLFIFLVITSVITSTEADVAVSGLSDLTFTSFTGHGDVSDNMTLCVCSDSYFYNVIVQGSGSGYAFTLANGTHTLAYTAYWNDSATSSGKEQLTANTTKYNQSTSYTCIDYNCSGTKNAYFEIAISESALLSAVHGSYSGNISIIVEPN